MIRVSTSNSTFSRAWCNANRALPVQDFEKPYQYGKRWREAYKCRVDPASNEFGVIDYIFDRDEDYTLFLLRWL
jgi:hypothetical protein